MKTEEEGGKTPFERAGEVGKKLKKGIEIADHVEMSVPTWLAAILIRFPKQTLAETGILVVPKRDGMKIVVSKDRQFLLERAFVWASEDKKSQDKVLVGLYRALFYLGQASMTPGVTTAQIIRPHRALIELHAEQFPPLRNLGEYVDGGGELTDLDKENLAGITSYIFNRLKVAGHPKVQIWEGRGLTPDNMFVSPDE